MEKINAVITGVGGFVPEYVLNNEELSRMVDTNDEWIMSRIGIKERRILNEEGLGTSYMARKAVKQLLEKTGTDPQEIECLILATTTPDYPFPTTSSVVVGRLGMKNAFCVDQVTLGQMRISDNISYDDAGKNGTSRADMPCSV